MILSSLINFNRKKKVHKDKLFGREDILQFFSGGSKNYKYVQNLHNLDRYLKNYERLIFMQS